MIVVDIILVDKPISRQQLKEVAKEIYGDFVKAVIDVEKGIMAISGELHADQETFLLERNSRQDNLWGVNLYPDREFPEMIEFDSMINIRPRQKNRSRSVEDAGLRERIGSVVKALVY